MYKKLIFLALILGSNFPKMFGQKTYFDLMINRIRPNLNYGAIETADFKEYKKPIRGIQAGASFQAGITPMLSVVPELYFINKGGKQITNNITNQKETSIKLNTLELPILARLHFWKMYVNAGPSFAYNFSGKLTTEIDSQRIKFDDTSDGFERLELGLQMGAGIEIPLKVRRIALDVRYNYGLSNISNNKEIYNRALMLGVRFSKAWKYNPFTPKHKN